MSQPNLTDYVARIFASFERVNSESLKGVVDLLRESIESNCRIWIIGNGGSAATASHFATDLNRCTNSVGESVKAMSLCDNTSLITAIGNDFGYDQVFSRQLHNSASSGDLLIILSASGNSRNIISALEWAQNNKVTTLALTGFDGGQAKVLADTLDQATDQFLENDKSPSRKVGELDNRGSHFYLALYWAQALAAQNEDADLKSEFTKVAKDLKENESKIIAELNGVQGVKMDIGGYYKPTLELESKAMRPSATLNEIIG